uniref:E2 NEDD8-conjugating enzyme n=1 Tax=Panagrellus redivivus TaxID=6233 RepID=A0A7E4ZYP0_PANRE
MFNLQKRINGVDEDRDYLGKRVTIRDKLLLAEVEDLKEKLRDLPSCRVTFPKKGQLHELNLQVAPTTGMYKGGLFGFQITVPPEYNNVPPVVKCLTRVYHPNISEDGAICLSLLRQNTLDGFGWMPTRRLADVVLGLHSLFTDLIDFKDPLNTEAAKMYESNPDSFQRKVTEYIRRYCN